MRFLTEDQIYTALHQGRFVEQFIGPTKINNTTVLRWLDLRQKDNNFNLTLYEVFDDGSDDFLDIYSFEQVYPDK